MANEEDSVNNIPITEKETSPKYKPVDYGKGTVDLTYLGLNKPDKKMAIEGGHAARSALDVNYLTCRATKGGSSCKPATTWWQAPGEYKEQATPVCDKHAQQLSKNALSREQNPAHFTASTLPIPQTWPIHPRDVARDTQRTALERAQLRHTMEMALYSKGMRGEDAQFARKNYEVGKPGPQNLSNRPGARAEVQAAVDNAAGLGGHQSRLKDVDPETGEYINEPRSEHYLRKKGAYPDRDPRPSVEKSFGGAAALREKKAKGGRKSPNKPEEPKPLANTFNSDGSQAYGFTIDQPIGFGAGDIDWHPEKYPEEVASNKAHKQVIPRGFSKTKNRAVEVTIGKPFKPEYEGGLFKYMSEQKEKRTRDALDLTSNDLMMPGTSRATEFELAQEEGRGSAIENVKKPKQLG